MNFEEQMQTFHIVKDNILNDENLFDNQDIGYNHLEPLDEKYLLSNVPEIEDFKDSTEENYPKRMKLNDDEIKEEGQENDFQIQFQNTLEHFRGDPLYHNDQVYLLNNDYSDMPKLEPLDAPEDIPRKQIQKPIHQEPKPRKPNHRSISLADRKEYCGVCLEMKLLKELRGGITEEEKLVIMIGQVLKGMETIERAKWFMMETKRMMICPEHVQEAVDEICEYLNIKNLKEIIKCNQNLMRSLMTSVNSFAPSIDSLKLKETLSGFLVTRTNEPMIQEDEFPICFVECSICFNLTNNSMGIKFREEKLVIMVARVLNEHSSIQQANSFIFSRSTTNICSHHILETIHTFLKILEIGTLQELSIDCSWQTVLPIVQDIWKGISTQQFLNLFRKFTSSTQRIHELPLQRRIFCTVCKTKEFLCVQESESIEDDQLIVIIGQILKGKYTVNRAKMYLLETKKMSICQLHFEEANEEICNFLHIENLGEYVECREDSIEKLMNVVAKLPLSINISKFKDILGSFDRKYSQKNHSVSKQDLNV